uniref:Putative terminase n=1 Tax=viral metagenome TaxID=1070528 RepID=A0A6M3LU64_9ZZZZ
MLNRRKNRTPLSGKSSKIEDPPSNKVVNFIPSNKEKGFFEVNKSSNKPVKTTKDTKKSDKKEGKSDQKVPLEDIELQKEIEWRDKEVARIFQQTRGRTGRPTKLNEQLITDLEVLARIGLSEKAMCESVMLSQDSYFRWKKRNKDFSERIKRARNTGKSKLVNSIYGHGRRNWQALAWLLERQYRDEYALDKQKVEVTGKSGGAIVFKVVYEERKEGV